VHRAGARERSEQEAAAVAQRIVIAIAIALAVTISINTAAMALPEAPGPAGGITLPGQELLGQETPEPTDTPAPTDTPVPTNTPVPTDTPEPSATTEPTETPEPTETAEPSETPEATPTEEGEGGAGDDDDSGLMWLIIGLVVLALAVLAGLVYYFWQRSRAAESGIVSSWDDEARDAYASAAALQDQITSQLAAEQSTGAPVDLSDAGRRAGDVNAQFRRLEISPPDDARRFAVAGVLSTLDALRTTMNLQQTGAVTLDAVRQRLGDYSTSLASLRTTLGGGGPQA
jgi:hypothetical protein